MNKIVDGVLWSFLGLSVMIGITLIQAKRKSVDTQKIGLRKEIIRLIIIWGIVIILVYLVSLKRS